MTKTTSKRLAKSKPSLPKSKHPGKAPPKVRKSKSPNVQSRATPAERTADSNRDKAAALRPGTKQARVIAMLSRPAGATVDTISAAIGWQSHSVRGLLAGVIRKKLALNLVSAQGDKGRVYRIVGGEREEATASTNASEAA